MVLRKVKAKFKMNIIVLLLANVLLISGCQKNNMEYVEDKLNVNLSGGKVIKATEIEDSFHGDGQTIIQINIGEDKFVDQIKDNADWSKESNTVIDTVLYGYEDQEKGVAPMISEEDDKPIIPKIEKGFFYFKDKNNSSSDKNNLDFFKQPSFNFIVAVYDCETSTLYYCEYDS